MSDITWVTEVPQSTTTRGGRRKWDAFVEALKSPAAPADGWALAGENVLITVATRLRKYDGVEVRTVRTPEHAPNRGNVYARYVG